MLRAARRHGGVSEPHVRDGRPHRADAEPAPAVSRRPRRRDDVGAREELPRVRHSALRHRQRESGHRPRDRARARPDAARHDDRLRRQPHVDARRLRRDRVRHRHLAGARRPRLAVPGHGAAEGPPHHGERHAPARRLCEGRDPRHHPPPRREGRQRLRVRVRRRRVRSHDDGRAHDRLQHVDRRRRARRAT